MSENATAPTELKWMSVQVPEELREDFKRIAEGNERSVSAELRRAMRKHIERHEASDPPRRRSA